MSKTITTIIALVISSICHGQYTLKNNSFISFNKTTGDMTVASDNPWLQCGDIPSGSVIEYLVGGSGTYVENGITYVDADPNSTNNMSYPFNIDYKLNGADWCEMTANPSTPAWDGMPPIGTGSGEFTRNIYTGIPEGTTNFTLSCSPSTTNYAVKSALVKNDLELVQMYNNIITMAHNHNEIFAWDILTGKIRTIKALDKIELPKKFVLMVRQVGSEMFLIPTEKEFKVPGGYVPTSRKYSTLLTVTNQKPVTVNTQDINQFSELPTAVNQNHCTSYSYKNEAALNISIGQDIGACDLTNIHEIYLSAVIFEQ